MEAKILQIGLKNDAYLSDTEKALYQVKNIPIATVVLALGALLFLILALYNIYKKVFKR